MYSRDVIVLTAFVFIGSIRAISLLITNPVTRDAFAILTFILANFTSNYGGEKQFKDVKVSEMTLE